MLGADGDHGDQGYVGRRYKGSRVGIAIGAGIFARLYPALDRSILKKGTFPADTIPELIGVKPGIVAIGVIILIIGLLYLLAVAGL